ncbi:integral membrane protein [Drechmeria coniospora]|uniref:Integral membrane protein n=1 Tax=Drechmeria coniospora TaxID=98403 RepID=A0A151GEF7_DRECN|nr:integral membrane protein [Drechmeria coniospora]KYK55468.1 integral membrane protein [Drechmeria coniospora]ODA81925.1 hypothetical protein RJ55_00430 [Drechmeria coniospora]
MRPICGGERRGQPSSPAATTRIVCRSKGPSTKATVVKAGRWIRRRRKCFHLSSLATMTLLAVLLFVFASPVAAVRIDVTNCLAESYRTNEPKPLQWMPKFADAKFDTLHSSHNLQLIVWGDVEGSQNQAVLPPPNDTYWKNADETNGKIIETADPNADKLKATTLYSRVNVLSYEPWHLANNFCHEGLVNGTCPLAPTFLPDRYSPDGLPSVNISHNFNAPYAFASFAPTILIIYGDAKATNIGCMSATITPDLGGTSWILKFLPLLVLLLSGFAVLFAAILSPWGTTNIFHWSSNYGRDADLLRLITPGFGDCLQYIQFIALTGGLSLSYPGYYQPVVSQVGWSALMFNESLVTNAPSWQSLVDGIYVTNVTDGYGLHELGQLIGMAESADIWPGMMVWLCVIIAGVFVLFQAGFLVQWLWRRINNIAEEDLRAKNIPFSVGNVVRIVFNYMLMPIVALSTFQLFIAGESPAYIVALAALTLLILIGCAVWILLLIIRTRPKSVLFDDLPTVLRYGPLYNTYADEVAAFALIPILLNFIRGIAIGAVQTSGVSQIVMLAICEVLQIFTLHAFRPFSSPTSMNAYHTLFAVLRAVTILLMVAFVPTLGVTEGPKGWIGYAILLIHGGVLILGFFLSALRTLIEVIARMLGAGGDNVTGLTRGGLSKIFGMRQLSRREIHRAAGPSRVSQLSTAAMLDAEEGHRSGYVMPGGRVRSGSVASLDAVVVHHRHKSSSALDYSDAYSNPHRALDTPTSYMPGTPGDSSTFSFVGSPTSARHVLSHLGMENTDPFYRPPRRRRDNFRDSESSDAPPVSTHSKQVVQDAARSSDEMPRGPTPPPSNEPKVPNAIMNLPANRPDYSTREVDFYYGVRGPALNSEGPGRRLGTGPADPTGPVATATGWFRTIFGGKTKEKGKGFEVVRSSRMPTAMVRNGGFGDETPPEGIPVAMGVLRNGPIDSDDDVPQSTPSPKRPVDLLTGGEGPPESGSEEPASATEERNIASEQSTGELGQADELDGGLDVPLPAIPRKSSKRNSQIMDHRYLPSLSIVESNSRPSRNNGSVDGDSIRRYRLSALPFESAVSQKRLSTNSSVDFATNFIDVNIQNSRDSVTPNDEPFSPDNARSFEPESPTDLLGSSARLMGGSTARRA